MKDTTTRNEAQDETTETTEDEVVFVGTKRNSSRGAFHTDRDCHLLAQTSGSILEKTRHQAADIEERDECSACAGEVSAPDSNDPLWVLRKLGYNSVHGGA